MEYSLKKPNSTFWKTGWSQEKIESALEKGSISTDWVVCPVGEIEKAIVVSEFLGDPDVFKRELEKKKTMAPVVKDDPILLELQKSNEHLSGIKWACRSVALLLAVIVFFGAKVTFNL